LNIRKIDIRPTQHYLLYHSDVEWDLIVATILSPAKTRPNKRYGKERFTYLKRFRKFVIEVHVERDPVENTIWVINAFKIRR
jgi:hypothetical protein